MSGERQMNPEIWEKNYDIIIEYRPDHHIWLLMGKQDHMIYIGKCMEVYDREVMEGVKMLENPHIPNVFEVEEDDGSMYVVEEYIAGKTLAEWLESGKMFNEEETVTIAIQICEGLVYLHSRSKPIIHRDLKPSNIMMSNDHVVKLIDYNAARYYEKGMLRDTHLIGTSGYAAPEQFGFAQSDARTDIYALGIVMKELLRGEHGSDLRCGSAMRKIIEHCTHIDPEKRYRSAERVKRELEKLMEHADPDKTAELLFDVKLLWPIPGFRSKKMANMAAAVIGYSFIFSIAKNMEIESNQAYPVIQMLDKIGVGVWLLFLVALATNYMGIKRKLSLLNHSNKLIQLAGYVIWVIGTMLFAAIFPEIVQEVFF